MLMAACIISRLLTLRLTRLRLLQSLLQLLNLSIFLIAQLLPADVLVHQLSTTRYSLRCCNICSVI